jgi:fucose permease
MAKHIAWLWILLGCIVGAMMMLIFVLPQTVALQTGPINAFTDIPFLGFAFPLVGLFIAPIYPLLNSAVLTALPKKLHSPMTGLIIVFSAVGGTLGSRAIGYLFKNVGADSAFSYVLIPLGILMLTLFILYRMTRVTIAHENT